MPRIKKEAEIKKEPKSSKEKRRKRKLVFSTDESSSESSAENLPLKHKNKSKEVKGGLSPQRKKVSVTLRRLNPPRNSVTARISTRKVSQKIVLNA